jgi:hypothetical protein
MIGNIPVYWEGSLAARFHNRREVTRVRVGA